MERDPLLVSDGASPVVPGAVDHLGRPAARPSTGGWVSAYFTIGAEVAERFSYRGLLSNLIIFLTGPLGQPTAEAAAAVNLWSGVAMMLPVLGAFVADSFIGRYRTIVISSILYVLGFGMLTLFATLLTLHGGNIDIIAYRPSHFELAFIYLSLYLVAFAQGGHKPCNQAFGADQFDPNDPAESRSRSSFFNWWYFSMSGGIVASLLIMSYAQEYIGWGAGFGIPCIAMSLALLIFLLGTKTYRYYPLEGKSTFDSTMLNLVTKIKKAMDKRDTSTSTEPTPDCSKSILGGCYSSPEEGRHCSPQQKEAKVSLLLFPIWGTCIMYGVVFAQAPTFFNIQGSTMDRRIGPSLQLPPVALQVFISGSSAAFIPIYDRVLVPLAKKNSRLPSGITMLQRIGIGLVLSALSMVIAALVEMKRLETAKNYGLVDLPTVAVPMSLWWLVPQFILYGISEAFTIVGMQEFFYDQVPDSLRSFGISFYCTALGVGSLISGVLVSLIDIATSKIGKNWFSDNLNQGHLDYFYWFLAASSGLDLIMFMYLAQKYVYKKKSSM